MRRRSIIGTSLAVVVAMGLSACGGGDDSGASETVRVTLVNHVWTENIKQALPEFEQADRAQGRGHPARRGPALRPVQRQAERRLQRHRRDDVPPSAGGKALRQEQVPGRPDRQGEGRQGLGLRATSRPARCRPPRTRARSSASRSSPSRRSSTTARTCWRRPGCSAPPKTLDELKAAAAKIKADEPGRRRLRRPHRQVGGGHPVLQLPVQLRRRLRRRQRQGRGQHRRRPSRRTPTTAGCCSDSRPGRTSAPT